MCKSRSVLCTQTSVNSHVYEVPLCWIQASVLNRTRWKSVLVSLPKQEMSFALSSSAKPSATSATLELDKLMASLSDFRVQSTVSDLTTHTHWFMLGSWRRSLEFVTTSFYCAAAAHKSPDRARGCKLVLVEIFFSIRDIFEVRVKGPLLVLDSVSQCASTRAYEVVL